MNHVSAEKREGQAEETLGIADIIGVLGNEFSNIYLVDCESQNIEIYRYENEKVGVKEVLHQKQPYKAAIQNYIETNVFSEDKKKMQSVMDFDNVCAQLRQVPQFTVHYRVKREGAISYYYMKCARIGGADAFRRIVFAFANEDADVRRNELEEIVQSGMTAGKRKLLIIDDNALNREMLREILQDRYEILTAENGKVGFEILEQNCKELSVILLDMQMPVCDGPQFLKRIREDMLLSSVPVIVITANDDADAELTCLNLGASDFIRKPYNADIVRGRIGNVIKLKESALTLAAVEHDELTGLYTKQAFMHYARLLLKAKADVPMHLVIAKIRDFQMLKSIYGAKKADEMLCYLASAYNDTEKHGIVGRKGISSFLCLLWGTEKVSMSKMEDVVNEIAEQSPMKEWKVKYGVYENIDKHLPFSAICDFAAMALETVEDHYDCCDVAYYTEEMAQKRMYIQMIENSFDTALEKEEFVVYYQPKVDIATERIIGAEALVRWKKDGKALIPPGDFIPVYEKDGLIVRLDEYMFRQVCRVQRRKMEEGAELLPISINLSRSSVLHGDVAERYIAIVKENGIPFSCVPIELTESAAIYNDRIKETTGKLADAGFQLHIDDFGAGYSSLISLNQFPFSTLKIDKSLIDDVCQKTGRTLVEQVITLARLLGMKVVAEGVETGEQLEILKGLNCDAVQGFYYAKPMPKQEFVAYVQQRERMM